MSSPKEKKATENFLEKQRMRASKKPSREVSPLSTRSQAELDRKPLSASEVEAMFVGAPYFNIGEKNGRYTPQVLFRGGDPKASADFSPDYEALGHSSFAASSLCKQRSREHGDRPLSCSHDTDALRPGSDLMEVPSFLGAQGLDPGAVGFVHFLQGPIADSTLEPDDADLSEKRKQLQLDPEWLGLRALNMEILINRLTELSELRAGIKEKQWESPEPWNGGKIDEMGEELFDTLLSAELGTTGTGTGSVTLKTQISGLQRVLNTKRLWHDFSRVEWRIRVGQLLWSSEELDVGQPHEDRMPSERDILLLQITLAAELLVRLHAQESLSSSFPPVISHEDAEALESQRTSKIQWDLLLAERFLENIHIAVKGPSESEKKAKRSSMFSAITFFTARETEEELEESVQPILSPKNEAEQLDGLVHFAQSIKWPHAQEVRLELESKLWKGSKDRPVSTAASIYATPLSSPKFPSTPGTRTSFFGFSGQNRRPGFSRTATAQSVLLSPARNIAGNIESFEVGGWLSRSWLSGLVMPGEPAAHFLISALLENSPQAITALGEEANLYGGFVYEGRNFWSKNCVVGRVLAASSGAVECMGWVSVPGSENMDDGWIDVDVKRTPFAAAKPRIKDTAEVARDSAPLHKQSNDSVQGGDFTRPTDGPLVMGNEVKYDGLSFSTPESSSGSNDEAAADRVPDVPTGCLTFHSPINSKLDKLTVPLTYDVHFISSYPCHPKTTRSRSSSRPLRPPPAMGLENKENELPTPRSKQRTDSKRPSKTGSTSTLNFSTFEKELPTTPAHPLHIDYQFDIVPAAHLLSTLPENRPRALSSPKERKMSVATIARNEDVVVLDCRGTADLELLARAWCAKVGESALIGKSRRTCLACCVREARALGVCVVIRI